MKKQHKSKLLLPYEDLRLIKNCVEFELARMEKFHWQQLPFFKGLKNPEEGTNLIREQQRYVRQLELATEKLTDLWLTQVKKKD